MSTDLSALTIGVWYLLTLEAGKDAYNRLLPRLSVGERARADEFRFVKDKLNFAASRVLLQRMLSEFSNIPAGGWSFVQNDYGKPALSPASGMESIRFNISHTAGALVVGVARDRDIGVDVELVKHKGIDCLDVARSQFAIAEFELLQNLEGQDRHEAFYSLWTLKEAYTKARGIGLCLPLSDFGFRLNPPSIVFSPEFSERRGSWFFWQDRISAEHVLAVAAEQYPDEKLICDPRQISLQELLES